MRQAFGGLDDAQHELAGDDTLLGHAEAAHILNLLRQALSANGGHVVEHHGQFLVDHGPQQARQHLVDGFTMLNQGIHGPQQMLVLNGLRDNARQADGLQPAQDAELGFGVAQAVDGHDAQQGFDVDVVAAAAEYGAQAVEAQIVPETGQRPDIAEGAGGLKSDGGRWRRFGKRFTGKAGESGNNAVKLLRLEFVEATEGGDGTLLGAAVFVAVGLDQLDVLARAGGSELDEHAVTLHQAKPLSMLSESNDITYKRAITGVFGKMGVSEPESLAPQ